MRTYKLNVNKEALTLKSKFLRALWYLVYIVLFRPSPRFCHAYRSLILRAFGAHLGRGVHVYPTAKIWIPSNLYMEENSSIDGGVDVYNIDMVHLKRGAKISKRAFLCTASHNYADNSRPLLSAPIVIGENSWLSAEVFVGPGVVIGSNVNIMARVSISHDVPANKVVKLNANYYIEDFKCN